MIIGNKALFISYPDVLIRDRMQAYTFKLENNRDILIHKERNDGNNYIIQQKIRQANNSLQHNSNPSSGSKSEGSFTLGEKKNEKENHLDGEEVKIQPESDRNNEEKVHNHSEHRKKKHKILINAKYSKSNAPFLPSNILNPQSFQSSSSESHNSDSDIESSKSSEDD